MVDGFNLKTIIGVSACNFENKFNLEKAKEIANKVIEEVQTK